MRGVKAAMISSPSARVGIQSVTAIPFFYLVHKVTRPTLISTRRDIYGAIALNHRAQSDLGPQFRSHQIHAADLSVQK
jgi:hypothetical protein